MTDWNEFLDKILDGGFPLDIRKSGSPVSFTRNQLGRHENINTETRKLNSSLLNLIDSKPFSVADSLRNPDTYLTIIDMGIAFIGASEQLAKKCASLFVHLGEYQDHLGEKSRDDRQKLLVKTSLALVKFIEQWKTQHEVLGEKPIYKRHEFLIEISSRWARELVSGNPLNNPNVVIGLIYLDEWINLLKKDIVQFFTNNRTNKKLFGAVQADMQRIKGNKIIKLYNYFDFIRDCRLYHQVFYDIISQRYPFWVVSDKPKDAYFQYAKAMAQEGWLKTENINKSIPSKNKEGEP